MFVKDVLLMSAKYLGLREVCDYLSSESNESNDQVIDDIEKLTLSINMATTKIASEYFELVEESVISPSTKFVEFQSITDKNIIEIKNCYGENSSAINFNLHLNGVSSDSNIARIRYSFFPKDLSIDDSIDFFNKINVYTIAAGVVGEYLFLKGDFEESYVWDERFKNSLKSILRVKRNIVTPSKGWL